MYGGDYGARCDVKVKPGGAFYHSCCVKWITMKFIEKSCFIYAHTYVSMH